MEDKQNEITQADLDEFAGILRDCEKEDRLIEKMERLIRQAKAVNEGGDWHELGGILSEMDDLYEEAHYEGLCFPAKR